MSADYGRFDIHRSAHFRFYFKNSFQTHLEKFFYCLFSLLLIAFFSSTVNGQTQLWQTNASGNDIHIFDIDNQQLIKHLIVGPEPHGITAPENADVVYVSIEHKWKPQGELLWIDPFTFQITHRLKIGKEPQALATTPDGQWIYVPCRDGYYWVIDGFKKKVVKKIYTGSRPHNTRASADGQFMYLSAMGEHQVSVVSIKQGHEVVATLPFSNSVRPSALLKNQEYFFQHVDGLVGFEVAHIPSKTNVARVLHSESLGVFTGINRLGWLDLNGFHRCHGLDIRPGQTEIWSTCGHHLFIHDLTALDNNQINVKNKENRRSKFPQTHHIILKDDGYWLTFSPDDRFAFIALKDTNEVVMIDTGNKKIVSYFRAGNTPKRNLVINVKK